MERERVTRGDLRKLEYGSAVYVVAHGRWRKGRGKRPSVGYSNMGNPREALKAAEKVLRQNRRPLPNRRKKARKKINDKEQQLQ